MFMPDHTRMMRATILAFGIAFAALPASAHDGVHVTDAYIRTSGNVGGSAAAFMTIENHKIEDERLLSARSDLAARVELHTHREEANGVMKMLEVPEGFVIPAGGVHALARGGDHIMFFGLTRPLKDGDSVTVTLTFALSGEVVVELPVDNAHTPEAVAGEHTGH